MKSIRSRLLISMVLTGLVPLVVVLVPLGTVLNRTLRQQEEEKLAETVRQLSRLVAEVTDRTARELASLQSNPLLSDPDQAIETKITEMHRLVEIFDAYTDISLYDSAGLLLGSTTEAHPSFREYSDWFRKAAEGEVVISHPQRSLGREGLFLSVFLPVESSRVAERQVIKARLSFTRIVSILRDTPIAGENPVFLLDALGNTLYGGDSARLLEKFDPLVSPETWQDQAVGVYTSPEGKSYLYSREILPPEVTKVSSQWTILSLKPMEEVTAVVRQALFALAAATILMMVAAIALGMFLARIISRPLERIGDIAGQVARGDLTARADEHVGSAETRVFASLFNRMVGEVAQHRESLEELVVSRTAKLHQSQVELEQANARLHAAIESTNNGFLVEDLSGEIALVNDLFLVLLGMDPAWSPAPREASALLNEFPKRAGFTGSETEEWFRQKANGKVIDREIEIAVPERRVLHVHSAPIRDSRENIVGRVWSTRDLTEQRQLEEGLRQSQKMEAVGRLAGGIAHDFNNLLAGILGNLALVKMELGEEIADEARESLSHATKAGERAAELVKQLLGFSRRSRLDLKPCDANVVMDEVRDIIAATVDPRIRIELDLEEEPWQVMADVGMLGQVIMNMAVNAKDAMPNGGRLSLRSGNRRLSAADLRARPEVIPGEYVCLTVEDEGEGIPQEVQAKIFEPFFTTKEPGKGTGLGLATSFGIVKQLGGWIDFTSVSGEGTKFDIYLPRSAASETGNRVTPGGASSRETAPTPSSGGETILLVDDEVIVRRIGRTLLTKLGYQILEAGDGLEALELIERHGTGIDLVLLDLTMPNLSGREAFDRLRKLHPDLPVLICSGYLVDLDDFMDENGSCPDGFVQKPYRLQEMANLVRMILDSQRRAA